MRVCIYVCVCVHVCILFIIAMYVYFVQLLLCCRGSTLSKEKLNNSDKFWRKGQALVTLFIFVFVFVFVSIVGVVQSSNFITR